MTPLQRVAVRNLALLHTEATPQAVLEEIKRLEEWNRSRGSLADLRRCA